MAPHELLDVLAERLVEAQLANPTPGAALVRIRPTADGVDLGLWPVPRGVHPVEALVGSTVGPRWSAAGLLTEAAARPLDLDLGAAREGPGHQVVVAVLVDREGNIAHRTTAREPGVLAPPTDSPTGRVVDLLHRTLGLPTPPPITAAGPWWADLWLDRIVASVASSPEVPRTLLDLAALHPLVGPGLSARDATVLHRLAPSTSVAGWEVMRQALASADDATGSAAEHALRRALVPLVSPAQARWFDQGSFARWLEATLPPRATLLAAADSLLGPRLARILREAVGE